jgi:hypothetical protein
MPSFFPSPLLEASDILRAEISASLANDIGGKLLWLPMLYLLETFVLANLRLERCINLHLPISEIH